MKTVLNIGKRKDSIRKVFRRKKNKRRKSILRQASESILMMVTGIIILYYIYSNTQTQIVSNQLSEAVININAAIYNLFTGLYNILISISIIALIILGLILVTGAFWRIIKLSLRIMHLPNTISKESIKRRR